MPSSSTMHMYAVLDSDPILLGQTPVCGPVDRVGGSAQTSRIEEQVAGKGCVVGIGDEIVSLPGHRAKRLDQQMPPVRVSRVRRRSQHLEHRERGRAEVAL